MSIEIALQFQIYSVEEKNVAELHYLISVGNGAKKLSILFYTTGTDEVCSRNMTLLRLETGDAEVGSDVTVGKGGNLQEIIVSVETGKYPSMGTRGSTQIPKTQETFGSQNFSQTFSQHTLQQKRR